MLLYGLLYRQFLILLLVEIMIERRVVRLTALFYC